jgi:hypothetical protein
MQTLETALPTRVVDCTDTARPKVYITNGSLGIYAALSYVWGEKQPHRAQMDNIKAYTEGIELDQIPQTIRDAIVSTQLLGLQYLWVDSLCILQDSKEDKNREIPLIRKIFQNAYVTIIAASSRKVCEGFLQDQLAPPPATRVPFRCPNGSIGTMWLRSGTVEPSEPVDTRAWCYEERLLSPRALVFASNTVRYECQTHTANIGNANGAIWRSETRFPGILPQPDRPLLFTADTLKLDSAWSSVVAEYTKRDLTHPRDKLIAFYGIAETFHNAWKTSRYLAGLWSHRLLEELLWQKSGPPRFPRPEKERALSWSWAAIDGQVVPAFSMHNFDEGCPECEILQCEVTLANKALPFGEVTGGILRLNAIVKEVLWDPSRGQIFMPNATSADGGHRQTRSQGVSLGYCEADCEEVLGAATKVWAIPLRSTTKAAQMIEGLIVVPHSSGDSSFRRVGAFQIPTRKPKGDTDLAAWLAVPKQNLTIV